MYHLFLFFFQLSEKFLLKTSQHTYRKVHIAKSIGECIFTKRTPRVTSNQTSHRTLPALPNRPLCLNPTVIHARFKCCHYSDFHKHYLLSLLSQSCRICFWLDFFFFLSMIFFLTLLNYLSVFSFSSLSYLKTTILNYLSDKLQISMSLE